MKKALITLTALALAGVASADELVTWNSLTLDNTDIVTKHNNSTIGNAGTVVINEEGFGSLKEKSAALGWIQDVTLNESWKLSFTLNDKALTNRTLLFSNNAYVNDRIAYQAQGAHWLEVNSQGELTMGGETSDAGLIVANTPTAITLVFIAKEDINGNDLGGSFYLYVGTEGEKGRAVLSYDVEDRVSFTENSTTRLWTNGGNEEYSGISICSGGVFTVPEPTTATLSLLALAGLAARRRRR